MPAPSNPASMDVPRDDDHHVAAAEHDEHDGDPPPSGPASFPSASTTAATTGDADDDMPELLPADEPPPLIPAGHFLGTLSRRHSRASSTTSSALSSPSAVWVSPGRYRLGAPARGPGVSPQADASGSGASEPTSPDAVEFDLNGATFTVEGDDDFDGAFDAVESAMPARALRIGSLELVSPALVRRFQALRGSLLCYVCQEDLIAVAPSPSADVPQTGDAPDPDTAAMLVRALPCRHLFHEECLSPWISRRTTCPTCRHDASPQLDPNWHGFDSLVLSRVEDEAQGASSPESERPETPPPIDLTTPYDGVHVADPSLISPPRTPIRPTAAADREATSIGGSPDDKSESPSQARIAPPQPPQSPLAYRRSEPSDDSDVETEPDDAQTPFLPQTPPLRPTQLNDTVRTPSLSPELPPFRPSTPEMPRSAAPPRRFNTMDDILVPLLNNPQPSPLSSFPRPATFMVADVELGSAHRIVLDDAPSAISFSVSGAGSDHLSQQLLAAGMHASDGSSDDGEGYSLTLSSDDLLASLRQEFDPDGSAAGDGDGDDEEVDGDEYEDDDDEEPVDHPARQNVILMDAVRPEITFEQWLVEREAAHAAEQQSAAAAADGMI